MKFVTRIAPFGNTEQHITIMTDNDKHFMPPVHNPFQATIRQKALEKAKDFGDLDKSSPEQHEADYRIIYLVTDLKRQIGRELNQVRRELGYPVDQFSIDSGLSIEPRRYLEFGAVTDDEIRYFLPRWVETLNAYGSKSLRERYTPIDLDAYLAMLPEPAKGEDIQPPRSGGIGL